MNFKSELFSPSDKILAAVSGGVDSIVLLHLLVELKKTYGFGLAVAHLNHQIRKDTAERDADFVENLARNYGVPFHLSIKNVPQIAEQEKLSLEDAGRKARYDFFFQEAAVNNYNVLALAHHLDDQTETIIFRLLRGAAARGLSGIAEERTERGLRIVRPLLNATKTELYNYARENKLVYQEDETNQDIIYTRNKLRNEILPLLQEINPNYKEGLQRTAEVLREDEDYLQNMAVQVFSEVVLLEEPLRIKLDAVALQGYHRALARRVVRLAIEKLTGTLNDVSLGYIENFLANGLAVLSVDDNGKLLVSK